MKFDNRYAVVTGAAQGIGYGIAKKLLEEGVSGVAILDMNEERLDTVAAELNAMGKGKALAKVCNVADNEAVKKVMQEIEAEFGKIDILVNNAGITRDAMFHKMTMSQWDLVIDVNLKGTYNCTSAVFGGMRERSYGRVINIASTSAYGNLGQANYAATKAAVIGFAKTLAKEGARKGITANAIAPDFIDTEMMRAVPADFLAKRLKEAPMQRMGTIEELAAVVAFLASDEASYVSGVCIDVTGATRT